MLLFKSKTNEKRILSLLMQAPTHMRALSLDLSIFSTPVYRDAAMLIQRYVRKHKNPPSFSTLVRFTEQDNHDLDELEQYHEALSKLKKLPKVPITDASFEFETAENMRVGRSLLAVSEKITKRLESGGSDYVKLKNEVMSQVLTIGNADASVFRGNLSDTAKERYDSFTSKDTDDSGVIPYGIKPLDDLLGGMRKTFVTLMYSKTGGGKTRTAINIAYNAAMNGQNVMYISLEMAFNLLASCFDSRLAWVDSNDIIFGRLNKKDKKSYRRALKKQLNDEFNVWVVDVSMGAKSSLILEEVEYYKAVRGVAPDLVIVDYANIMEPSVRYNGRSEKYDYLFQELHEIAKYANVALLTATQESRDASKADIEAKKKKASEVEQGVHNIGLSNYMAPHCETVLRLKQDSKDALQNRLWVIVDKNRYGNAGAEVPLMALWDKSYVGDKVVKSGGLKVKRQKSQAAYEDGE